MPLQKKKKEKKIVPEIYLAYDILYTKPWSAMMNIEKYQQQKKINIQILNIGDHIVVFFSSLIWGVLPSHKKSVLSLIKLHPKTKTTNHPYCGYIHILYDKCRTMENALKILTLSHTHEYMEKFSERKLI